MKEKCDFTVIEGHVGRLEAERRGEDCMSSPHHYIPSKAFKVVPMPFYSNMKAEAAEPIVEAICESAKESNTKVIVSITDEYIQVAIIDRTIT